MRLLRTTVALVAVTASLGLVAACTSSSTKNPSSGVSGAGTATGTPKAAGNTTLTASFGPVPAAIDPGNTANIDHYVYQPVLGVLATYPEGANGQFASVEDVKPELAQSWVHNSDGSYTFTLRSMKSSAGNPLTSNDVLWSFQRSLAINPIAKLVLKVVGGDTTNPITVIDATHFKLNATADNPNLLGALPQFEFGIFDSVATKAHATASDPWAKDWSKTNIVSFGPYVISAFTPSTEIDYTANPNYWNSSVVSYKKIVDRGISDNSTMTTLLKSGQLNFAANVAFGSIKGLESSLEVNTQPTPLSLIIALDLRKPPFNKPEVRQAVSLALDRSAVSTGAFSGYATPANSLVSTAVANTPRTPDTYFVHDASKAKQLLASAGYPSGFAFPLYYSTVAGTAVQDTAAATLIKQQLASVGVTVNLMPVASAAQFSAGETAHSYQAILFEAGPLIPDIAYYSGLEWSATSLFAPGYDNQQLISITQQANSTTGAARTPLLQQILNTVDNELPDISVVDVPNQWVMTKGITGAYSNGTQGLYPWLLKG